VPARGLSQMRLGAWTEQTGGHTPEKNEAARILRKGRKGERAALPSKFGLAASRRTGSSNPFPMGRRRVCLLLRPLDDDERQQLRLDRKDEFTERGGRREGSRGEDGDGRTPWPWNGGSVLGFGPRRSHQCRPVVGPRDPR